MAYEVDLLAVGDGERSGDAMAIRYIDSNGTRWVAVIDGGTKESGQNLVDHIKAYYGTDEVDYVISTHADADHASGLTAVLEQLKVGALLMHQPWNYAQEVCELVDREISAITMEKKIIQSLKNARELEKIAKSKNIPIYEPFQGVKTQNGLIHVLGPSEDFYKAQLFGIIEDIKNPLGKLFGLGQKTVEEAVRYVRETLEKGSLMDPGDHEVGPNNNSSAIILFQMDGNKLLFTGDAGAPALHLAADYAEASGITLNDLTFFQVPHHGSKHNVGPTILNRIVSKNAFISAAAESPKHPSKKVTNELFRKGTLVHTTQGINRYHFNGFQLRTGWTFGVPLPFYEEVEE